MPKLPTWPAETAEIMKVAGAPRLPKFAVRSFPAGIGENAEIAKTAENAEIAATT